MYFEPWERAQESNRKRKLEELKTEQRLREGVLKTELDRLRQTERDLRKNLKSSRQSNSVLCVNLSYLLLLLLLLLLFFCRCCCRSSSFSSSLIRLSFEPLMPRNPPFTLAHLSSPQRRASSPVLTDERKSLHTLRAECRFIAGR